jgi:activator of HSP90 ATPase
MSKQIKQTVRFEASPKTIYQMLLDSKKHSAFTGEKAKIDPKVGGKFQVYGGYIDGVNVELIPGKLIVQSWRCATFPKNTHSLISFELKKSKKGTELVFTHTGVPSDQAARLNKGWKNSYWDKMKKSLGEVK